jgi:hypothetical protein
MSQPITIKPAQPSRIELQGIAHEVSPLEAFERTPAPFDQAVVAFGIDRQERFFSSMRRWLIALDTTLNNRFSLRNTYSFVSIIISAGL